jgi:hypothetical protein
MARNRRLMLLFLGAVLLTAACDVSSCNQIINPTPVPSPSPSPSSSPTPASVAGCDPVYSVGVSVQGHPNPLVIGQEYELDATPKGPDGTKLDPICHGSRVAWTLTGAPCTLTGNTSSFNPRVRCTGPGTLTAQACVSAPGGCGSVTVPVA